MFSNPKTRCCRPKPGYPCSNTSNEECVRDCQAIHKPTNSQKSPLLSKPLILNPDLLSSFDRVYQAVQLHPCPNPQLDCCKSIQKRELANPVYQKYYTNSFKTGDSSVYYNIPPVDYQTYLKRQEEQLAARFGSDFGQKSYMTSADVQRARFYNQRGAKRNNYCPCPIPRGDRLPHCCGCTCAYYEEQKLKSQEEDSCCKQDVCQQENRKTRRTRSLPLPIRKKSMNKSHISMMYRDPGDENDTGAEDCENKNNQQQRGSGIKEYHRCRFPVDLTTYRCHFKYKNKFRCPCPEGDCKTNNRPPWNKSTKPTQTDYKESIAAAESKLTALDGIRHTVAKGGWDSVEPLTEKGAFDIDG